MDDRWITVRRIVCLTETGERVMVFRLLRTRHLPGQRRHRYVLSNSNRVVVAPDSKFRIAGTKQFLQPILVMH